MVPTHMMFGHLRRRDFLKHIAEMRKAALQDLLEKVGAGEFSNWRGA